MTEQLGRIEKPEAGDIAAKRKLYIAPFVSQIPGAPDGYASRLEAYWRAVDNHTSRLEARAGIVRRIFHEGISYGGDPGVDQLKQANIPVYPLVNSRIQAGATLEALDDDELFLEALDWSRVAQNGFASRKVMETVQEALNSATEARFDHMARTLDEKLGDGEAGLLIISSTRGIDMADDIEQFNIMPPELDELSRWLQETARAQQAELEAAVRRAEQQAAAGQPAAPPGPPPAGDEGPRLWTPGRP